MTAERVRHNSRLRRSLLPLSEVLSAPGCTHPRSLDDDACMAGCGPRARSLPIREEKAVGAGGRLTHTAARFVELNGGRVPGRVTYPVELIAREIRDHRGDVWPSVQHFGISYEHALRIRNGWRGARNPRAKPVTFWRSRNVGMRTPPWLLQPST